MINRKSEFDIALTALLEKIERRVVLPEDFNNLIAMTIGESSPEAVRDRLRRRTLRNETDSHIDNETGHQPLTLPSFQKRVQPKRKPSHQQSHGRSKLGHNHSVRTQQQ